METEVQAYLARVVPDLERSWSGARQDEIEQLAAIAGRPLPAFYLWFLATMGRSIGRLADRRWDISAARVLARYRDGSVSPHPRYLLIGEEPDQVMPMLLFYDLDRPTRDDAMVVSRPAAGGALQPDYETFREMLTIYATLRFKVTQSPQRCRGSFTTNQDQLVVDTVTAVLHRLGFSTPVIAGAYSAIFERGDASMSCRVSPNEVAKGDLIFFEIGGPTSAEVRSVLGELADSTSVTVEIREWIPALP